MVILEEQEKRCLCVSKHVPLPMSYIEIDGIYLCPTTYSNMHVLRREYEVRGGKRPPGHIRKHFSDYVQKMVQSEYD